MGNTARRKGAVGEAKMIVMVKPRLFVAALLLLATGVPAQQDQTPRLPVKNDRGLLQINRLYFDLAANTGGDFYFWAPGEFATARLQVPIHREDVILSYGDLESKKIFEIPIESGAEEMTLFAGIQRKDLALLIRPNGRVARDGDGGVAQQVFQHMMIATVKSPAAGVWRLELTGAGAYAVTAHVKPGKSGPELVGFDFVEPGGRPGHEGMFPIKRAVHAGESLTCRIVLSGSVNQAELDFVTKDGSFISTTPIVATADGEYAGRCSIPATAFRVLVRAVDASGVRFQRIESPLRNPESR